MSNATNPKKFTLHNVPLGESLTFSRPVNDQNPPLSDIPEAAQSNEITTSPLNSALHSVNDSACYKPPENANQSSSFNFNVQPAQNNQAITLKIGGFLPGIPMAESSEITIVDLPPEEHKQPQPPVVIKGIFKNVQLAESGPINLNNNPGQSMNMMNPVLDPHLENQENNAKPPQVTVNQPSQRINVVSQGFNAIEVKADNAEQFPDNFSYINRSESLQGAINKTFIEELETQQPELLHQKSSPQPLPNELLLSQGPVNGRSNFFGHVSAPNIKESSRTISSIKHATEPNSLIKSQLTFSATPCILNNFKVDLSIAEDSFLIEAEHLKSFQTYTKKSTFEEISQLVSTVLQSPLQNSQVSQLLKDTIASNDSRLISLDDNGKVTVFLKTESLILGPNYIKLFEIQLEHKPSNLLHNSHQIIKGLLQNENNSPFESQLLKAIESLVQHNVFLESQLLDAHNRIRALEEKKSV